MMEVRGRRAGSARRENGCRALAGGTKARLSSDHQLHFSVSVCVCTRDRRRPCWLCLSYCWALAWWHRVGSAFMCINIYVCVCVCVIMLWHA